MLSSERTGTQNFESCSEITHLMTSTETSKMQPTKNCETRWGGANTKIARWATAVPTWFAAMNSGRTWSRKYLSGDNQRSERCPSFTGISTAQPADMSATHSAHDPPSKTSPPPPSPPRHPPGCTACTSASINTRSRCRPKAGRAAASARRCGRRAGAVSCGTGAANRLGWACADRAGWRGRRGCGRGSGRPAAPRG